jgi:hypothetical protein
LKEEKGFGYARRMIPERNIALSDFLSSLPFQRKAQHHDHPS